VFGWRTEEIVADERIRQQCVEGPGNSAGKTLTFTFSDDPEGTTLATLSGSTSVSVKACDSHSLQGEPQCPPGVMQP
jgi:hypothetical protein